MQNARKLDGVWLQLRGSLLTNIPDKTNAELTRKVLLMYGICGIGTVVLTLLGCIAFIQKAALLGTLDFAAAAVLLFLVLLIRFKAFHASYIYFGIAVMAFFYAFIFITGGVNGTAFMWYFTFPLFAHFLLGPRQGLGASILLFIPAMFFLGIDLTSTTIDIYNPDFAFRFIPSYLTVVFFSYMYECSREASFESPLVSRTLLSYKK